MNSVIQSSFDRQILPGVLVTEASLLRLDASEWDTFAQLAGASLHGSYRQVWVWQARSILTHRVRVFNIAVLEAGGQRKIAQCAVAVPRLRGTGMFLDGIHLLPGQDGRYAQILSILLDRLGDGRYLYGRVLSLEPDRQGAMRNIEGLNIETVRNVEVHAVDFSRWESWSSYFRAISENSKRSSKSAMRKLADLHVAVRSGASAARLVGDASRLNDAMAQRKKLPSRVNQSQLRYMLSVIFGGSAFTIALAYAGGRALSSYFGAEFGDLTYYLEGGSDEMNLGSAWYLLLTMLERAFNRHPRGRFIMGYVDYATHTDEASGGLIRSRDACRISRFQTSIVGFSYRRSHQRCASLHLSDIVAEAEASAR